VLVLETEFVPAMYRQAYVGEVFEVSKRHEFVTDRPGVAQGRPEFLDELAGRGTAARSLGIARDGGSVFASAEADRCESRTSYGCDARPSRLGCQLGCQSPRNAIVAIAVVQFSKDFGAGDQT
jgi:hypothetical protein